MDEEKNKQAAESVVAGLQKDFTIVGSHRVHSWYAWAMVGIVFGMALGVVYVANRSGEFAASQAAGLKITVQGLSGVAGNIYKVGTRNSNFIADAGAMAATTGQTVTTGPGLDYSFAGTNVRNLYNFDEENVSAAFQSADRSTIWLGKRYGQKIYVDTTDAPTVEANRQTVLTFKGIYVTPKNQKKTGTIGGTLFAGIDVAGTYAMEGATRSREITGENPITIARGMPLYANPSTPMSITTDGTGKKFTDKTFLLPGKKYSGTWTLTFQDKNKKKVTDGDVEITDAQFTEGPNHIPTIEAIPDQTVVAGQTLHFTVKAIDPDTDPIFYYPNLSSGFWEDPQVDPATGVFTWTPAPSGDAYVRNVTLFVADNRGNHTSASPPDNSAKFKIIVTPTPGLPGTPAPTISFHADPAKKFGIYARTASDVIGYVAAQFNAPRDRADQINQLVIENIEVTFTGTAVSSNPFGVSLANNSVANTASPSPQTCTPVSGSCTVRFDFTTQGTSGYNLWPSNNISFNLVIDSTQLVPGNLTPTVTLRYHGESRVDTTPATLPEVVSKIVNAQQYK